MTLRLYRLITGAIRPALKLYLHRRAMRGKEDPDRLGERLGRTGLPRPHGPLVWVHSRSTM